MSYIAIYKLYPQVVTINGEADAFDANGNPVEIDMALVQAEDVKLAEQQKIEDCKSQASKLLYETDWTTIPDVANPENSPYLANQAEFIAWRSQIRQLAVNPVANPVFPSKPSEVWA